MKLEDEVKFRFVLIVVGLVITAFTQILINTIPPSTVFVHPSPYSPRWLPLNYKHWMGPFWVVRIQEAGLMALAAGFALWVRPFIFDHEQLKYDSEKDPRREEDIGGLS